MQHESGKYKHMHGAAHENHVAVKDSERRGSDRHTFTASAEVVEQSTGARFATRTTDLGPGGCFVDCTIPFPVGCRLRVNLEKGKTNFATTGTVVYSQTGLGMGIAFDELNEEERRGLDAWLEHVTGEKLHTQERPVSVVSTSSSSAQGAQNPALVRLVQLLIGKGMLTEAEGSSVLFDPVL
jgi:PilZ domain-containing protein